MTTTSPSHEAAAVGLDKIYAEIRTGVRETDAISFKLLGLVPLVSGAALIGVVFEQPAVPPALVILLSSFASTITLGLFRWELRNIQTCSALLAYAEGLEEETLKVQGLAGVFQPRPRPLQRIGKTEAEKLIYATTIATWLALPAGMGALSQVSHRGAYLALAGVILIATAFSLFASTRVERVAVP